MNGRCPAPSLRANVLRPPLVTRHSAVEKRALRFRHGHCILHAAQAKWMQSIASYWLLAREHATLFRLGRAPRKEHPTGTPCAAAPGFKSRGVGGSGRARGGDNAAARRVSLPIPPLSRRARTRATDLRADCLPCGRRRRRSDGRSASAACGAGPWRWPP
jgi:hypothetical protein